MGAPLCLPARFCGLLSFSLVCLLPCCPPLRSWQLKSALVLLNTEAGRIRPLNACHGQRLYQWFFLSLLHWCQWQSSKTSRMRQRIHILVWFSFISPLPLNHAWTHTHTSIRMHWPACFICLPKVSSACKINCSGSVFGSRVSFIQSGSNAGIVYTKASVLSVLPHYCQID